MNFELREYQKAAVQSLRSALASGLHRVILSSPTGSGKTEMGFELIRSAHLKGKKVAFVANRVGLVDQTCRRLDQAGFEYGLIQGANTHSPWKNLLVCTIQTLKSRGCPEDIDLFVMDEAHACAGTQAYREIMAGKYVIGLTATPYSKGLGKKYDSLGGPLFEKVIIAAKIQDLIDQGFLVSADVWAPADPDLTGVKVVAGDYNEEQLGKAMDKATLVGDIVSHWFKIANDTATVVFATNISHSKHIVEQFIRAGVTAEHVDCYTEDAERIAILERVTSGQTRVISNVSILAEGWDFPACKTLILARPTKSLIRYLQMAGRVLRPYPGKSIACIIDHSGVVKRIGFPWDYFGQQLDDGTPKKPKANENEEAEALPQVCPECKFMKPPKTPKCPNCGFESKRPNKIILSDGELVPLTPKTKALPSLAEFGKPRIYAQLLGYARSKGYKDGWIAQKYRTIFDVWPRGMDPNHIEPISGPLKSWLISEQIRYAKSKGAHENH